MLEKSYEKYGTIASELSKTYFGHITDHRAMFTDAAFDQAYMKRFNEALGSMFPDESGKLPEFRPLDCDYTSQPTNALWFSVNAMRLLDQYGIAIYGADWERRRNELEKSRQIDTFNQIKDRISKGLPSQSPVNFGSG